MRVLVALILACGLTAIPTTSEAGRGHSYYGDSAAQVARAIGCRHLHRNGAGDYNHDSGVCHLRGKRVNVITFTGPEQQGEWNGAVGSVLGAHFYWGNGRGAVVVARNGNRPAAKLGARLLPGSVKHGY